MHPRVLEVTERLIARSRATREAYLALIRGAASDGPMRGKLQCANFAHGVAGCGSDDKNSLRMMNAANIAIVSSYNDMLSAHQPYEVFPELIKKALREIGSVGQFAGGVPAMCDGVTQGEPGMELSLFSREVIALSTAVALSSQHVRRGVFLGICDKIVPGLVIGALSFGHLPDVFMPAGPMTSGLSNDEKSRRPPALRRGQGQPRRAAGGGIEFLSRPRHLHLLRHRQHQPDADGDHGVAPAGRLLRQPEHAAA
jgi:phosphogluconate dehydratase